MPGISRVFKLKGVNIFQKHVICVIATHIWKSQKFSFVSFLLNWIFSTSCQILWNSNNSVNHSFTVFCLVLRTQCMKSNETKWKTWPMSRHNFHLNTNKRESPLTLWPNSSLEKAPTETYCIPIDQEFWVLPARELDFLKFSL